MTEPRKLSIVDMKVLKQLIKIILFSLLIQARRQRRTDPQVINKVKGRKLLCECGEKIVKDGENQWIQRLMGLNRPVDGKKLRCGYSINDMHSTNLVNTLEKRKYKRKCISKTGFCYSMEMKRKDGTHTINYGCLEENNMRLTGYGGEPVQNKKDVCLPPQFYWRMKSCCTKNRCNKTKPKKTNPHSK